MIDRRIKYQLLCISLRKGFNVVNCKKYPLINMIKQTRRKKGNRKCNKAPADKRVSVPKIKL